MAEFLLDGQSVPFEPGQSIMQAAQAAGWFIPHLCYHEDFAVHGSCRICMVRINGRMLSACTLPAAEGMQVENNCDEVNEVRRQLLEMLFTEGNHQCPICEKSGDCLLQSVAVFCGMVGPRLDFAYPNRAVDASHPDFILDYNRCINCELCVRASRDVDGKDVFSMQARGHEAHLAVNSIDGRLGTSNFDRNDRAAWVCPVGVILPKHKGFDTPLGKRHYDLHPLSGRGETGHGE